MRAKRQHVRIKFVISPLSIETNGNDAGDRVARVTNPAPWGRYLLEAMRE